MFSRMSPFPFSLIAVMLNAIMWHILPSVPRIYLWEDDLDSLFVLQLSALVVGPKLAKKNIT